MNRFVPLVALVLSASSCAHKEPEEQEKAHQHGPVAQPRAEIEPVFDVRLDPSAGGEIGLVFESYLSPQQEADEETETPKAAPSVFKSTKPSTPREERLGRGHGVVAFTKDFSRAYVHLAVTGIDPEEIVMAHLHCGRPGMLGPIIVDFGSAGNVSEYFADGTLHLELTNRDLEHVVEQGSGVVGAFTAGCPIHPARPNDRIRTLSGMAVVAMEGQLYFNVHTASQTFYGDIRGTLLPLGAVAAHDASSPAPHREPKPVTPVETP
ncbi:MAG: CHRD domain-containing protein [Myxococcota bacterium]